MASIFAFKCSKCEQIHEGAPSFAYDAPLIHSQLSKKEKEAAFLDTDLCRVDEHRFIRVCLEIPIIGFAEPFLWGVWVSLSEKNFARYVETFDAPDEGDEYFGWFCNQLPFYPETLSLKTKVHPKAGGTRPLIELEPTDHPLALDFHQGISVERAQMIAETAKHGISAP
jgi:hypothetical protein